MGASVISNFSYIVLPTAVLGIISIFNTLITASIIDVWDNMTITLFNWGTFPGFTLGPFSGSNFLIAALIAIGVIVAVAGVIPTEDTSGAMKGFRILLFAVFWGVLSATAYSAIASIPIFGTLIYFALTVIFSFGVIQGEGD